MTRRRSSGFGWGVLALLGLVALGSRATAPSSPAVPSALERPKVQTGGADPIAWAQSRFNTIRLVLATIAPQLAAEDLRRVALSVLAQWSHETNKGRNEFNFNLGGWMAAAGEPFFRATGAEDPGRPSLRFASFDDLTGATRLQLERLRARFPSAVRLLVADPESSAWVEQLGKSGYYTAPVPAYARAWAMHRTELGGLLAGVA